MVDGAEIRRPRYRFGAGHGSATRKAPRLRAGTMSAAAKGTERGDDHASAEASRPTMPHGRTFAAGAGYHHHYCDIDVGPSAAKWRLKGRRRHPLPGPTPQAHRRTSIG